MKNIFKKLKQIFLNYLDLFIVRGRYLWIALFSSLIFILILPQFDIIWPNISLWLKSSYISSSSLLDWFYCFPLFDPLIIFFITASLVLYKHCKLYFMYYLNCEPSNISYSSQKQNKRKGFIERVGTELITNKSIFKSGNFVARLKIRLFLLRRIVFFLIMISIILSIFETTILHKKFHINKPITRLEHLVIKHNINNRNNNTFITPTDLKQYKYICPAGQFISKYLNAGSLFKLNEEVFKIENNIGSISKIVKEDYKNISDSSGQYKNDIDIQKAELLLIRIQNDNKTKLYLIFTDLFFKENNRFKLDSSCPSGFVMRQMGVFLLVLLLIFRKKFSKYDIFKSKRGEYLFLLFNIIIFSYIPFSDVYGLRHTLYDAYISLILLTLATFLLIFGYYKLRGDKLKEIVNKLDDKNKEFENFKNSVIDAFYKTDENGILIECNNKFEQMFFKGRPFRPSDNINIRELYVYPEKREKLEKLIEGKGKISDYIVYVKPRQTSKMNKKERFFISVDSVPFFYGENREKKGIQGTVREISALIEKNLTPLYRTDTNHVDARIEYCNEALARLVGLERHEIINMKIRSLWENKNERADFLNAIQNADDNKVENYPIFTRKAKNGKLSDIKNNYELILVAASSRLLDEGQKIIEGSLYDVTLTNILLTHAFHGVYIIQKEKNKTSPFYDELIFKYVNDNLPRIFGYEMPSAEFIIQYKVEDLVDISSWARVKNELENKLTNDPGAHSSYPFKAKKKDRNSNKLVAFDVEVNSTYIESYKGYPAVAGYIRDITADEMQKRKFGIEQIEITMHNILHQIFNPVDTAVRQMEYIKAKLDDKHHVSDSTIILKALTESMDSLRKAKNQTEFLSNYAEVLNIHPILLKDIIDSFLKIGEINKSHIIYKTTDDLLNMKVLGSLNGTDIILQNLYRNSIEAKSIGLKITISASIDKDYIYIIYSNNGPKIDAKMLNSIFDILVSDKEGRRGYGLFMAKSIMLAWNGDIYVETNETGKVVFIIKLRRY